VPTGVGDLALELPNEWKRKANITIRKRTQIKTWGRVQNKYVEVLLEDMRSMQERGKTSGIRQVCR
jgi:hypothetical protein